MTNKEYFPDGTPIDEWFYQTEIPTIEGLGKPYVLTDYGVFDDGKIYTEKIQALIDCVAAEGGGVIVVPEGTYRTGALFFKQGVHLYVREKGVLMGSDDVCDYPVMETRIEGESCLYLAALINADNVDGFTIFGKGKIDGNGLRSWRAFWQRRKWNPACTNKDEQRPRLIYISHSKNVTVAGLRLQNSHFWTNHLYKCHHVRFIGCDIFSPKSPVNAPSTDGLDIDVCTDILVKGCRFEVDDDAIALKGGKGPWADTLPENGGNERILVEDCEYGPCCAVLTCGSESIYNKNVLVRRVHADGPLIGLWLKMRPDTPQRYEYIKVEKMEGFIGSFLLVKPWTQFFDLKGRKEIPLSYAENITMKDCRCKCHTFFDVEADTSQYVLSNIALEDLEIQATENGYCDKNAAGTTLKNVTVTDWQK